MTTTTIRINVKTKKILDEEKIHPRETYDDLLLRFFLRNDKLMKVLKKNSVEI